MQNPNASIGVSQVVAAPVNTILGVTHAVVVGMLESLNEAPHTAHEVMYLLAEAGARPLFSPPAIGEYWAGQGGVYAGQVREDDGTQYHLILSDAKPASRLTHAAATKWAKGLGADGHSDFELPTRRASALLYANLSDRFEKSWHWTSTNYSESFAWVCSFSFGSQHDDRKDDSYCARAVRRLKA